MNQKLKILTPSGTFTILMNSKTLFLSKPFISLYQDFVNSGEVCLEIVISGFVGVSLININTSTVFCWSLVGSHHICFDLRRGTLAAGSLLSSSVGFLVGSSVSSSLLGFSSLGYRYGFTVVVLKSVGPLGNYTLHVSLSIPSNLNGLVHLPLCPVLSLHHISISKLRGRLWIVVIDGPFCWFNALLTYFFALILVISSIAFFMAATYSIIDNTSRSSLFI